MKSIQPGIRITRSTSRKGRRLRASPWSRSRTFWPADERCSTTFWRKEHRRSRALLCIDCHWSLFEEPRIFMTLSVYSVVFIFGEYFVFFWSLRNLWDCPLASWLCHRPYGKYLHDQSFPSKLSFPKLLPLGYRRIGWCDYERCYL